MSDLFRVGSLGLNCVVLLPLAMWCGIDGGMEGGGGVGVCRRAPRGAACRTLWRFDAAL